ncbi:MAG TPA: hypothetical protein VG389_17960 [Myxococcota bacterium]|jgi:hypothetical protein|nr:hypothetical protein [Myxococcota bacterium]
MRERRNSPTRYWTTTAAAATAALAALLPAVPGEAVTTLLWRSASTADFNEGELDHVVVTEPGRVAAGLDSDVVRPGKGDDVSLFWSAAAGAGGTVWLGSGNKGELWKLEGGKLTRAAETGAMILTDLVVDGGDVYASSIPDGKIFKYSGGKLTTFCDLEEAHVWSLVRDAKGKRFFAGVGPGAKVYEIDAAGKAKLYYDAEDQHVTALALDPKTGSLYMGTSNSALLLEVTGAGKARAVADFDGEEIGDLALAGDDLWVSVSDLGNAKKVAETAEDRAKGKSTSGTPSSGGKKGGKIYKVGRDGRITMVHELKDGYFTALGVDGTGMVYAGEGTNGKVFRYDPKTLETATVFDFKERQALALVLGGKTPIVATGDAAAVYTISTTPAKKPVFYSVAFDAGVSAEWGATYSVATGKVTVRTRSGNTAKPDATWSDWSGPLAKGAKVSSPRARYLQFRVDFDDVKAVFSRLDVYFLPLNYGARVDSIAIAPEGDSGGKKSGKDKDGVPVDAVEKPSATMKVSWKTTNPDGDTLRYKLAYRSEGDTVWIPLNDGKALEKDEYKWDTGSIPDGYYELRVEAVDDLGNPAGETIGASRIAPPALVDNGAPDIKDLKIAFPVVSGTADDTFSPIARIEYAVDAGDWSFVFPSDRLYDSPREAFKFNVAGELAAGKHVLVVRARDAAGNATVEKGTFTVAPKK